MLLNIVANTISPLLIIIFCYCIWINYYLAVYNIANQIIQCMGLLHKTHICYITCKSNNILLCKYEFLSTVYIIGVNCFMHHMKLNDYASDISCENIRCKQCFPS